MNREMCTYVEHLSYTEVRSCDKKADVIITTFGVKKPRCITHAECEKNVLWDN